MSNAPYVPQPAGTWQVREVASPPDLESVAGRWDELVSAVDGCATQTSGWLEYALATDYQRGVLIAGADEKGEGRAVAVGFVSEPRWPLRRFRTMHFPAYPSTRGDAKALREAVAVCERAARERRCIAMDFVGIGQPDASSALEGLGYATRERLEYVFDLTQGEAALWEAVKRQHRKNTRRSERAGVRVVRLESLESVRTVRALQEEVARRHAARDDGFGLSSPESYEALHHALVARGFGRVYCSYLDGVPVSAALFLTFGRHAMSVYSGSNAQGLECYGEYGLYWHAMAELSREGFIELQLGSADLSVEDPASPARGLHEFKLGFGAQTRRVVGASKTLRPVALRVHRSLQRVRSCIANGKRRSPPARAGAV
jgi:hypothetical protein